jgi:DNA polymerase-3 subunit epsilon
MGGAVHPRVLLDRHGAELWANSAADGTRRLCLQLPASTRVAAPAAAPAAAAAGRPIAYDFDLFNQPGQNATLDETALVALAYTVFDTETTGLRPSEGDEIISIGAVRIVNAKLLDAESFDRRVKPRRAVRASAFAVHGISTESLAGEPPLEDVLPSLARFCEGTVLVGHNAAFDMRFLELARERTGVRFDQPVLDTMLLAAVVQPGHRADEHHLEQVAHRLGVEPGARHQALGDATTTARVFLKLLPLLAERGITTLGQARAASMRAASADERY